MFILQDKVAEVKTKIEKMDQLKKDVEYIMNEYSEEFNQKTDLIELKQKFQNLFKNQSQEDETIKEYASDKYDENAQNNIFEENAPQNDITMDDQPVEKDDENETQENRDCEDEVST